LSSAHWVRDRVALSPMSIPAGSPSAANACRRCSTVAGPSLRA